MAGSTAITAVTAYFTELSRMLGTVRQRTPGNILNRCFVRRQLNGIGANIATPQRLEALRRTFRRRPAHRR